ncbi:recombinase RecA [Myxococcus sp. MISCRS1]|jgi:recombination protein RecA|uniref:recombinase RecA n=1 Tax=Myxococcus TaxID=32 RepID=UPI001144ED47|nr:MULTISPECIES: recombinase RecA [Myxococcus]BDT31883.1 recombinase RecA [Myxococcus sp. MH1]MBZ4400324.1 recombinase RecA [Myxococcus sp. AS-1-15]MBZ4408022.1 recombinase RecA [Myxococcus sp. XM-1-1-1]MCK8502582.1 recombinase RecA [Myxococcus fulvus]MCY0998056.1 recombinase RecA [Myxococcus sp. MISCRS1]
MAVNQEKEKAIELAMSAVERQFGKGSIMRLGNDEPLMRDVQAISTGSISLDIALGVGGVPKGRIIEIFGPESSGKTTLCLHIVAEAQKRGGICGYVDAEHALDVGYARKLGVRTDDLLLSQPDTGEQALEIAEMLVRSGAIDVLVVDSVAALVPKAELEGEMGDAHMGVQARLMSQALRKLTGTIAKSQTCVIFINQIRMKIGVMFGNPETTTGGNALKFYASQRLDIRRIGAIKNGENVVGSRTRVKVVKNKVAPPFKEVEFDIMYGTGISREGDLIDLASNDNIVEKSGSWFSFNGERIGQGRENAKDYLREHPEVARDIETRVLEKYGIAKGAPLSAAPAEEAPAEGASEKRQRVKAVK